MTIEELLKAVEELNKRQGPKIALFIQTFFDSEYGQPVEERVKTQYQFMVEDWQMDCKTLDEATDFVILWEKVHAYKWI